MSNERPVGANEALIQEANRLYQEQVQQLVENGVPLDVEGAEDNDKPDFPTITQGPGINVTEVMSQQNWSSAPINVPVPPEPKQIENIQAWPGVAWLLLLTTYFYKYASRRDSVYSWAKYHPEMGGLPRNLTRKPDHKGNLWEVVDLNNGWIRLSKTPNEATLRAAETTLESVRNSISPALREYFVWKKRLPQRIHENAEAASIKEAQQQLEYFRGELDVMRKRYDEAFGLLERAEKTEYLVPTSGLDNLCDYDIPLEVKTVPVFSKPPQPILWPDLDGDDFDPDRTMLETAIRVGAVK